MGIDELAGRSRQELSKWLERVGVMRRNGQAQSILAELVPERLPAAVDARLRTGDWSVVAPALLDSFRTVTVDRFFQGAVDPETPRLVTERMPESRERTIAAAESVCRGRFDLMGYRDLFFGDPVDWH